VVLEPGQIVFVAVDKQDCGPRAAIDEGSIKVESELLSKAEALWVKSR
jgi:hypothetical protein